MKAKRTLLIGVTLGTLLLASCGDKEEIPMIDLASYEAIQTELDEAYAMIDNGIKLSDMGSSSLKVVNGATTDEFSYVKNQFVLPSPLTIEGSKEDVSASHIQVGSYFKFAPSENWTLKMGGTTLHLNHSVGVMGQISALNIRGFDLFTADFKDMLLQYSKSIPTKNSTYNSIYVGEHHRGALAVHDVTVNGAAGQLVVGLVAFGDVALSMVFVLDGKDLPTQLELTKLLVTSGFYNDSKIRIE